MKRKLVAAISNWPAFAEATAGRQLAIGSEKGEPTATSQLPQVIFMLSLTEKLLLTEWAVQHGIKVFWIEHDRIGSWLKWNPWLPKLKKLSSIATTVCVSELSRRKYLELGWEPVRTIAIPNGIPSPRYFPHPPAPSPEGGRGGPLEYETTPKKPVLSTVLQHAREMRRKATEAEEALWERLQNRNFQGLKFRRQHPVGNKILDFYCHEHRLGIEVDGEIHQDDEQQKYDRERTIVLEEEREIRILRFRNEEVLADVGSVLQKIEEFLASPLPPGEGQGVRENQRGARELKLGCLARLSPEKGVDVLLHAIADLPEVTLSIVGSGPQEGYLRQLMMEDERTVGVSRITLRSNVLNLDDFFSPLDAFVLPSSDHDPFGLSAAEAMGRGVPTIVTDACGIAGYLESGVHALIVEAGSPEALKRAIQDMKSLELRAELSRGGSSLIRENFTAQRMVDQYEKILGRT